MLMQNIYTYNHEDKIGKLVSYRRIDVFCPYVVTYSHCSNSYLLYNGILDGRAVVNCMVYNKREIKLLHKKPLRHFIEKRQGK